MSQSDQFRQYAEDALWCASQSKDENEIQAFADLANVWALAALEIERGEAGIIKRQAASPQTSLQPEPTALASAAA